MFLEFLSYFLRIITLSLRLSANLTAGHIILFILSSFPFNYIYLFPLFILEIGVSFIQSFVFLLLFISYLNDL